MKRFFRKLSEFYSPCTEDMSWKEKLVFYIGGILGIATCIMVLLFIDKTPAKSTDYKILEERATEVQTNPSLLLKTDCNITIKEKDEEITVVFENKECEIYAKYNKEFELLSISRIDKSKYWLFVPCLAIASGIFVHALVILAILSVKIFKSI